MSDVRRAAETKRLAQRKASARDGGFNSYGKSIFYKLLTADPGRSKLIKINFL